MNSPVNIADALVGENLPRDGRSVVGEEPRRVELVENAPPRLVDLTFEQAERLARSGLLTVAPTLRTGTWAVAPKQAIGVASIGDLEVSIHPKMPIRRVLYLLGYAYDLSAWRDESVAVAEDTELLPAVTTAFVRQAQRAIDQGLLQGYRDVEESAPLLRGRMRSDEQLRRRFGLSIPLEVRYDDYTVDIPENRILRTAAERLLRIERVHPSTRRSLLRLVRTMADVQPLPRGGEPPRWQPSRLNARYHPALRLGELVLRGGSFDQGQGRVVVDGFMLNMAVLFEQFLTVALGEALAPHGGVVAAQPRLHLDHEHLISLRPDILWRERSGRRPLAVVDAKYKAEKPSGYPNADVYQMLTYCTRLGLREGHLVYARGEETPGRHHIAGADLTIVRHALDLDCSPRDLREQVALLAARIAATRRADEVQHLAGT